MCRAMLSMCLCDGFFVGSRQIYLIRPDGTGHRTCKRRISYENHMCHVCFCVMFEVEK